MAKNEMLICEKCKYKFKKNPNNKFKPKCPYCGSASVKGYEPNSAQKLIDEL